MDTTLVIDTNTFMARMNPSIDVKRNRIAGNKACDSDKNNTSRRENGHESYETN